MDDTMSAGSARRGSARDEVPGAAELEQVRRALSAYLEEWGFEDGSGHQPIVAGCLRRCASALRRRPEADPVTLAIEELERDLAAWAEFVLGRERIGTSPPLLLARVAFLACGGAKKWPGSLLSWEPPAAMIEAMRQAVPDPTPPEAEIAMAPQSFESWSLARLPLPGRATATGSA
jgi:hypothetical protein